MHRIKRKVTTRPTWAQFKPSGLARKSQLGTGWRREGAAACCSVLGVGLGTPGVVTTRSHSFTHCEQKEFFLVAPVPQ